MHVYGQENGVQQNTGLNVVTARFIACYTLLHVPAIFLDTLTTSPFSRLSSSSSLAWKSWMASTRHSCTLPSPIRCVICTTRSIGTLPQWRSCSFSPSHHSEVKMKGVYMYSSTYIPLLYSLWMIWSRAWNSASNTSSKLVTDLLNYPVWNIYMYACRGSRTSCGLIEYFLCSNWDQLAKTCMVCCYNR